MEATDIHTLSLISQIHWRPGIGDPTIIGWVTVFAYFAAFIFAIACAKRPNAGISAKDASIHHKLWWLIALVMLLLGINKQLDLQTLLTETGKVLAKRQGWYEHRRIVQAFFIVGIGCVGFFSLMLVWKNCQNLWKENRLTIIGLIFLVCFVVMRAASFHHMDLFLGKYVSGFKINWLLELGGIVCILMSAVIQLRSKPKSQHQMIIQKDIFL